MSMGRTERRVVIGVSIGLGLLALCCAGGIVLIAVLPEPEPASQAQASVAGSSDSTAPDSDQSAATSSTAAEPTMDTGPFDPAAWEAFAASGSVPPSVLAVLDALAWNGVALVAETSIVSDADARTPAISVCSALSAFWLTTGDGEFRPVQVIGTDGGVLVSRATLAQQCEWRRS